MRAFFSLVLLGTATVAASAALSGCVGHGCTDDLRASVSVQVVDANGAAVPDAKVTFTIDGGASEAAECTAELDDGAGCTRWVAGWERAGHIVVRAESADGTKQDEAAVDVTEDECHVQGKTLTLTL